MAASGMSRLLVGQILAKCVKTRSCHSVILHRTPKKATVSEAKRLLSTSRCLCEEDKNNKNNQSDKATDENKDSSVGTEQNKDTQILKTQGHSTKSRNAQNQSAVGKAKQASEIGDHSETSSLSDSSSSDSDSDSSSSDSDSDTLTPVDPALEKAAEDVAAVLTGDKAATKAELLAKLKTPGRTKKAPEPAKEEALDPATKESDKLETKAAAELLAKLKTPGRSQARKNSKPAKESDKLETNAADEKMADEDESGKDRGERKRRIVDKLRKGGLEAQDSRMRSSNIDRASGGERSGSPQSRPARQRGQQKPKLTEEEEAARLEKRREIIEKLTKVNISEKLGLRDDQMGQGQGRRQGRFNYEDQRSRWESEDFADRPRRRRADDREFDDRRPGRGFQSGGPRRERPFERFSDRRSESLESQIDMKPTVSAFGGKPLGIFTKRPESEAWKPERKSLYDQLLEEKEAYNYPPRNAWEEQIQLTRQGRLWTFPIDNEAGWEDEQKTGFQEHIFLERQIRDFPQKGPIRHFMELVTISLSKNPYMTVAEKHEHIDWFRQYFRSKEQVLVGPLGDMGKMGGAPQKAT